jgi:hypothetical protein
MFLRSLCFTSVALFAGCTYGNVGPAAPAVVTLDAPTPAASAPTPAASAPTRVVAPAHASPLCWSNDDCGANRGLCVPKAPTKEQSDAEDFLGRAMSLDDLVTSLGDSSSSSRLATIEQRVREDMTTYGHLAQGRGTNNQGAPLTNAEMQDAAWMQSGATQADMLIRQFAHALSKSPITTDAQAIQTDITGDSAGLHLDKVVDDLQTFLHDIEVVVAPINQLITLREPDGSALTPKSGAGALLLYLGPVMKEVNDATDHVNASLDPSAISRLKNELTMVSQAHDLVGKDGKPGICLESP